MSDFDPKDIHEDVTSDFAAEDVANPDGKPLSKKEISKLESFEKGSEQGLTLGTADEIGGGLQAGADETQALLNKLGLTSPSPTQVNADLAAKGFKGDTGPASVLDMYRQARDQNRKDYKEASDANPGSYFAGNIAGGTLLGAGAGMVGGVPAAIMSPLGPAAKTAPMLTKMATGALNAAPTAALASMGSSDADLTKGQTGDFAKDTAVGTGLGMGIGATIPVVEKGIQTAGETKPAQDLLAAYQKAKDGVKLSGNDALKAAQSKLEDLVSQTREGLRKFGSDKGAAKNELIKDSTSRGDMKEAIAQLKNSMKENSGALKDDDEKLLNNLFNESNEILSQGSQQQNVKGQIDKLVKNESFTPENLSNMDKNEAQGHIESDLMNKDFDLAGFIDKTFSDLQNGKQLSPSQQETLQQLQRQYRQSPMDANSQQIEKVLNKIGLAYDNLSPVGRRVALDFKNKLLQQQNTLVPHVKPFIADISDNLSLSEALLGRSNLDTMAPEEIPKFLDKNAKQFQKYDTDVPGTQLNIDNIINKGLPTEYVDPNTGAPKQIRSLKELNPEIANNFEQNLKDRSSTFNLSKTANEPVKTDSLWGAITGGANKSAVKMGEGLGTNVKAAQDMVSKGADWLTSADRPQLVQKANDIASKGGKAGLYFAHQLLDAANKNPSQRNTLIFSLMQQPAFRQMLRDSEQTSTPDNEGTVNNGTEDDK